MFQRRPRTSATPAACCETTWRRCLSSPERRRRTCSISSGGRASPLHTQAAEICLCITAQSYKCSLSLQGGQRSNFGHKSSKLERRWWGARSASLRRSRHRRVRLSHQRTQSGSAALVTTAVLLSADSAASQRSADCVGSSNEQPRDGS